MLQSSIGCRGRGVAGEKRYLQELPSSLDGIHLLTSEVQLFGGVICRSFIPCAIVAEILVVVNMRDERDGSHALQIPPLSLLRWSSLWPGASGERIGETVERAFGGALERGTVGPKGASIQGVRAPAGCGDDDGATVVRLVSGFASTASAQGSARWCLSIRADRGKKVWGGGGVGLAFQAPPFTRSHREARAPSSSFLASLGKQAAWLSTKTDCVAHNGSWCVWVVPQSTFALQARRQLIPSPPEVHATFPGCRR